MVPRRLQTMHRIVPSECQHCQWTVGLVGLFLLTKQKANDKIMYLRDNCYIRSHNYNLPHYRLCDFQLGTSIVS